MNHVEQVGETERALANANELALALVNVTESLEKKDRVIVQQFAWAIQEELETISRCLKRLEV